MERECEEGEERVVEGDLARVARNVEVNAAPGDVNRDSSMLNYLPQGKLPAVPTKSSYVSLSMQGHAPSSCHHVS